MRRPIWTLTIWNNFIKLLNDNIYAGPPGYRNSGESVSKAVIWALENLLQDCGHEQNKKCVLSVFSAISPWAEAILFHSAEKLSRNHTSILSVDFNPCVLDGIPQKAIAECISPLSLSDGSGPSIDLIVSYSGIEHDGLGRYGDPVNPNGDISALREMWLLTRPGGVLLVSLLLTCSGLTSLFI